MRRRGVFAIAFAIVMATSSLAWAEPSAEEATVAREQFRRGIESVDTGKWDDARVAFQRSYDAWPRLYTLLNLAGAQSQSGKLVASADSYRRFLREATGTAVAQKAAAEAALADVEKRTPTLKITPSSALLPSDALAIDERPIASALVGIALPVDPGRHEIVVSRAGAPIARATVDVAEEERSEVGLVVPPPPPPPRPLVLAPVPPIRPRHRDEGILGSPWLWLVGSVAIGATCAVLIAKD